MRRRSGTVGLVFVMALLATAVSGGSAAGATSSVALVPVLTGYDLPIRVTGAGGTGRGIFIVEQGGKIKKARFKDGRYSKLGLFLDISDRVNDPTSTDPFRREQGLLGFALHPDYKRNGRFYVFYTRKGVGGADGDAVIAEFRRRFGPGPLRANPNSERILMIIDASRRSHNGGHLAFGPDGMLYAGLGDDGGFHDPDGNSQNTKTLWGSILRINPRDPDGNGPRQYSVPRTNPFVGKPGRDQIWAYGLRHPWRFSFDRANGNLWIGDVGQDEWEEVNKARANRKGLRAGRGHNYGWVPCEGFYEHDEDGGPNTPCEFGVLPLFDYPHIDEAGQCSVTGGYVHRGPGARAWRGLYVAGDFCGRVFVADQAGRLHWSKNTGARLVSFGEDGDGRLFAVDIRSGTVFRVQLWGPRPGLLRS